MATYFAAPAVAEIADGLIEAHHTDLDGQPILYVFRDPAARRLGRVVLGSARRITGLNAFLVALAAGEAAGNLVEAEERDYTFLLMEVAYDEWVQSTAAQRAALVDHELCHFGVDEDEDGELVLKIRGHDLEEFNAVVERHGLWRDDVQRFAGSCSAAAAMCVA
jgi:hypothetical protein